MGKRKVNERGNLRTYRVPFLTGKKKERLIR